MGAYKMTLIWEQKFFYVLGIKRMTSPKIVCEIFCLSLNVLLHCRLKCIIFKTLSHCAKSFKML